MNNFIETLNTVTGKKKKRKLTSVPQPTSIANPPPKSIVGYDARPHQMGKPRAQAYNGVNQGAAGFLAKLTSANRGTKNQLLNGIMQPKKYEMPKFSSKDVLSNEWFNTALQRVGVRNQMKSDIAKRKTLADTLSHLLTAQSADHRSATSLMGNMMTDTTRRRGQDLDQALNMDKLKEQQRYHDIMKDYYGDNIETQRRGQDLSYKNRLAQLEQKRQDEALKQQRAVLDAAVKRRKVIPDSSEFKHLLPPEIANDISGDNLNRAYTYYVNTGKIPQFKLNEGYFSSDYEPIFDEDQGRQQESVNPASSGQQQAPQSQQKPIGKVAGKDVTEVKEIDGKTYYKFSDGSWGVVD